jgi:pilus assembly protein Flp/PilA
MAQLIRSFALNEEGATAIEYAMIAGIVGLGIIAGLRDLPVALNGVMGNAAENLSVE